MVTYSMYRCFPYLEFASVRKHQQGEINEILCPGEDLAVFKFDTSFIYTVSLWPGIRNVGQQHWVPAWDVWMMSSVKLNILLPFSTFQFLLVYIWLFILPPDVREMLHVKGLIWILKSFWFIFLFLYQIMWERLGWKFKFTFPPHLAGLVIYLMNLNKHVSHARPYLGALQVLIYLLLMTAVWDRYYYYPHLIDEEAETWTG